MTFDSDTYRLWLRYAPLPDTAPYASAKRISRVTVLASSPILESAASELKRALPGLLGREVEQESHISTPRSDRGIEVICGTDLELIQALNNAGRKQEADSLKSLDLHKDPEGFHILTLSGTGGSSLFVLARTDRAVLYGVFALLRLIQTGTKLDSLDLADHPQVRWRVLNHWDNLDGSIERGYAGNTLWNWAELPGLVDERYTDYARACASVGINTSVLNNVNSAPEILSRDYLIKVEKIASVLRRYGIKTMLSVNFASPMRLGGLTTADPLDPEVASWWKNKTKEIYDLIPDFGGFLVKADSEGQPGPYLYKRDHADGANMLAEALEPFGGVLIWRAFVYGHGESDRAKKAYADFMPLDGKFKSNAAVQVKNGPIDFQPREPIHPLFGGMRNTSVFMEFQVAQEYLGQGHHIVYLAPMWKEILDFDTHADGPGSSVGKLLTQDPQGKDSTGIAAVSNTGDDESWSGSPMHQANWYAFGRLAWDYRLDSEEIAREWISATFGQDLKVQEAVLKIMMDSWEACIDYMTPLGLHHIMQEGHHYGPDPSYDAGAREDWRSTYYHRADAEGLGFDRTRKGSAAVDQYHKPVADMFNSLEDCPEGYLLWFHHVPWDQVLKSGRTLKEELVFRYSRGLERAQTMRKRWTELEGMIDPIRYQAVLKKLDIQVADAKEWEEVCVAYFMDFAEGRREKAHLSD